MVFKAKWDKLNRLSYLSQSLLYWKMVFKKSLIGCQYLPILRLNPYYNGKWFLSLLHITLIRFLPSRNPYFNG